MVAIMLGQGEKSAGSVKQRCFYFYSECGHYELQRSCWNGIKEIDRYLLCARIKMEGWVSSEYCKKKFL